MEYIKILTIFAGIVTTIITFVFATRTIHYIAWRFREKIDRKVNKQISEWQHREYEEDRRHTLCERLDKLEQQLWEIETALNNNKKKGSK